MKFKVFCKVCKELKNVKEAEIKDPTQPKIILKLECSHKTGFLFLGTIHYPADGSKKL